MKTFENLRAKGIFAKGTLSAPEQEPMLGSPGWRRLRAAIINPWRRGLKDHCRCRPIGLRMRFLDSRPSTGSGYFFETGRSCHQELRNLRSFGFLTCPKLSGCFGHVRSQCFLRTKLCIHEQKVLLAPAAPDRHRCSQPGCSRPRCSQLLTFLQVRSFFSKDANVIFGFPARGKALPSAS